MNIDLHIEKLVLDGVAPSDRGRVGAAVERELARLLQEQGVPSGLTHGGGAARIDAGSFSMMPNQSPESLGVAIAQAVYGGMNR
jgi:hypothetical protein